MDENDNVSEKNVFIKKIMKFNTYLYFNLCHFIKYLSDSYIKIVRFNI